MKITAGILVFNNFFTTTKLLLDSLLSQTKNDNYIDVIVLDNGSTDDSLHHLKEYLKIILLSKKPDAYRNILAITFTNKVARGNEVGDILSIKLVSPYLDIAPKPPPIPMNSRFIC